MKKLVINVDNRNLCEVYSTLEKINNQLGRFNYPLVKLEVEETNDSYSNCTFYSEFEQTNLSGEDVTFEGTVDYIKRGDDNTKLISVNNKFIDKYINEHVCTCDKCKKNIQRGKYIVFSKNVDEVKSRNDFYIFGTTCAKDYFPFNIEAYINRINREFVELAKFDEFSGGDYCWGKTHIDCVTLAEAVAIVTNNISINYQKGETINEVTLVYNYLKTPSSLLSKDDKDNLEFFLNKYTRIVEPITLLNTAKDYFNSLKNPYEFDSTCKTLLNNLDSIEDKFVGRLIAAIYFGNLKARKIELAEKEHAKKVEKSNFVGEVGDKFDNWELVLTRCIGLENQWGNTYLYKFEDKNGNTIIWSTQKDLYKKDNTLLKVGDSVTLKGTIKTHKVYKDEKQTYVTRCKVL